MICALQRFLLGVASPPGLENNGMFMSGRARQKNSAPQT